MTWSEIHRVRLAALTAVSILVGGLAFAPAPAGARPAGAEVVAADAPDVADVVPLPAARLYESPGRASRGGGIGRNASVAIPVAGYGGVPAEGAEFAVVTLSATYVTRATGLTLHASDERPVSSQLVLKAGRRGSTQVVVRLAPDGTITLHNRTGRADVTVDVMGWIPEGSGFEAAAGVVFAGRVRASAPVPFKVLGVGNVPASGVGLVVLDVQVSSAPRASTLTFTGASAARADAVAVDGSSPRSTLVVVEPTAAGTVALSLAKGLARVTVSVAGWLPSGSDVHPVDGARLFAGSVVRRAPASAMLPRTLQVAGVHGVPADEAVGALLRVTMTKAPASGSLLVAPGDAGTSARTLVFGRGASVSALVVVPLAEDGTVRVIGTSTKLPVTVDLLGWIGAPEEDDPSSTTTTTTTTTTTSSSPTSDETTTTSTSTTTTSTTTTSTTTTSTTTTTTQPPPPEPITEWRFDEENVMFTEPGQSRIVELGELLPDGSDTGAPVPDDLVIRKVGNLGAVDVTDLGDGRLQITSTDEIGSVVIGVQVPGEPMAIPLYILNVHLVDGVQVVPDGDLVFPPAHAPGDVDWSTAGLPGLTETGAGPFTWEEIRARAFFPELPEDDLAAIYASSTRVPVVVRGDAPSVGTTLIDESGARISGTVVEPDGLPSLTRDGYSLLSLEIAAPAEVYASIVWQITQEQLVALGVVPEHYTYDYECPEATPPGECADLDATELEPVMGIDPSLTSALAGPSRRPHTVPAEAVPTGEAPARRVPADSPIPPEKCKGSLTFSVVDMKPASVSAVFSPAFDLEILPDADGGWFSIRFAIGFDAMLSITSTIKLQPTLEAKLECELFKKVLAEQFLPPPLAAVLSLNEELAVPLELGVKIKGGLRFEVGASCTASVSARLGFRWIRNSGHVDPIATWNPTGKCTPKFALDGGTLDTGSPFSIEPTMFVGAKPKVKVRIGGILTRGLAWIFRSEDLGTYEMADFKTGVRGRITWENESNLLISQSASGIALIEEYSQATVKVPNWTFLFKKLSTSSSASDTQLSLTLLEIILPVQSFYRAPRADTWSASIDGQEQATGGHGAIEVAIGDDLEIDAIMNFLLISNNTIFEPLLDPAVESGTMWVETDTTIGGGWVQSGGWTMEPAAAADTLHRRLKASIEVTQALCDAAQDGAARFTLVADTLMFNIVPTPGHAATFKVKCVPPELKWDRESIDFNAEQVGSPVTASLEHKGLKGRFWVLDPLPAWLESQPLGSPFMEGSLDAEFTVHCGQVNPRAEVQHTVVARSVNEDDEPDPVPALSASLLVKADCRDSFMEFRPDRVLGSGTTKISSFGHTVALWEIDTSGFPNWLSVAPDDGVLLKGLTGTDVSFTVANRAPTCAKQAARSYVVTAKSTVAPAVDPPSKARGTAKVTVVQPEVPPRPDCDPKPVTIWGDPHMATFDGGYYDAQVLGEYLYVRPVGGALDVPTIQARHENTDPNATGVVPTSVTAVAVSLGGHLFELYLRPNLLVLIDGSAAVLEDGAPVDVGDGLSVARNGSHYAVVAGVLEIGVDVTGSILNVRVVAPNGAPVEGLLGTPNGSIADDFTTSTGTAYTNADVLDHSTEMYDLTDSWRLDDVADSLFTNGYDGFDDPNVPYSAEALAPFRAAVIAALGDVANVCGSGPDAYMIDALAIELAIGRTLDDVSRYTCSYVVSGIAHVAGEEPGTNGIGGLAVTVDAPGLKPCVTTTHGNGTYACVVTVDLAEAAALGGPVELPFEVPVVGRWPGLPDDVVLTTASFDALAPLAGWTFSQVDLPIDPSDLSSVHVTGLTLGDGNASLGTFTITGRAYDGGGGLLAAFSVAVSPDQTTGVYEFTKLLPLTAAEVDLEAAVGLFGEQPTLSQALVPGLNEVDFDVDDRAPHVVVSGTMIGAGGVGLVSAGLRLDLYVDDTYIGYRTESVSPAADGTYSARFRLPKTVTGVTVTAMVGDPIDWFSVHADGLEKGVDTEVVLDVDVRQPFLVLSGSLTGEGGAPLDPLTIRIDQFNSEGQFRGSKYQFVEPDGLGDYEIRVALRRGTASATAVVQVGYESDWAAATATGLLPDVDTHLTLDMAYLPPRLELSGFARTHAGAPITKPVSFAIYVDGLGSPLPVGSTPATVDPGTGAYTATWVLPMASTAFTAYPYVDGRAVLGDPAQGPVVAGLNEVSYDVTHTPTSVRISGTYHLGADSAPYVDFWVDGFDGDGDLIVHRLVTVTPDVEVGTYSVLVDLPHTTVEVRVSTDLGVNDPFVTAPIVADTENQVTFVVAHGLFTLDLDVSAVLTLAQIPLHVVLRDGVGALITEFDTLVDMGCSGFCSTIKQVALVLPGAAPVTVEVSSPGLAFAPASFSASHGGSQTSVVTVPSKSLTVDGRVLTTLVPFGFGEVLQLTDARVEVVGYAVDGDDWASATPFTEVFRSAVLEVELDDEGRFTVTVAVPDEVTIAMVRINEFPEWYDIGGWWEYGVELPAGETTFTVEVDPAAAQTVTFEGRVGYLDNGVCPAVPSTSVVTIRTFAEDDVFTQSNPTSDQTFLVVPDPVTGEYRLKVIVPDGSGLARVGWFVPDGYPNPPSGGSWLTAFFLTPGSDTGIGLDLLHSC